MATTAPAKKKLIVEAEPALYRAASEQAKKEDRSLASLIRQVLKSYLQDRGHNLPD